MSLECGGVAVVEQSGGENGLYSSASPVQTCQFQSPSASSVTPQRLYFSSPGQTSFDYFLDLMLFHGDASESFVAAGETIRGGGGGGLVVIINGVL